MYRENIPSRSLERSDIDSNEILELEGKAPIPPKLPPLRGPPGVMPRELAEEPNDVLRANEELNFTVDQSELVHSLPQQIGIVADSRW